MATKTAFRLLFVAVEALNFRIYGEFLCRKVYVVSFYFRTFAAIS